MNTSILSSIRRLPTAAMVLLVAQLLSWRVNGLIMVGSGNTPVHDPGWPSGAVELANHPSRVSWWEGPPFGGGLWSFSYSGDTEALAACVKALGAVASTNCEIVLREGVHHSPIGDAKEKSAAKPVDWTFDVWVPASWERLYKTSSNTFLSGDPRYGKPMDGPTLQVWLRPGGPDWSRIQVPAGVKVRDLRTRSNGFPAGSGNVLSVRVSGRDPGPPPGTMVLASRRAADGSAELPRSATPDARGRVVIAGLAEGTFEVVAQAEGYAPRRIEWVSLGTNEYRALTTVLLPETVMEGTVEDDEGRPIGDVKIRVQNAVAPDGTGYAVPGDGEVVSDNDGRYRIEHLPACAVQIWAWKDGFYHVWHPKDQVRLDDPSLGNPARVIIRMVPTGSLIVRVVDAEGAKSKGGSVSESVHLQEAGKSGVGSWGGSSQVGPDGTATFKNMKPAKYFVSLKSIHDGQIPAGAVTVDVVAEKTAELTLTR